MTSLAKKSTLSSVCILIILGLLLVEPCVALETKPSVPQFSLKLDDTSFDVPPSTTTTIDPYTGEKTIIFAPGYHVDSRAIVVTIKNQVPHKLYTDTDEKKYRLYYHVQVKGHFGGEWKDFAKPFFQSDSEYTIIGGWDSEYKNGVQLDFRVQAIIGQRDTSSEAFFPFVPYYPIEGITPAYYTDVEYSGWSSVLTFTISAHGKSSTSTISSSPSDSSTLSPTESSNPLPKTPWATYSLTIIITICIIAIPVAIVMYHNKRQQRKNTKLYL